MNPTEPSLNPDGPNFNIYRVYYDPDDDSVTITRNGEDGDLDIVFPNLEAFQQFTIWLGEMCVTVTEHKVTLERGNAR